jgi:hypothetical protein
MTARAMPATTRWQIWVFAIAAVLAVLIGTIANGFFGQQWFFNADHVVAALPLALPFVAAAGVIAGQDRWLAGRTWLTAGAWLLAIDGTLAVVLEVQVALIENDVGGIFDAQPWFVVRGMASALAEVLGFGSLAAGVWLTRPTEWGGIRLTLAIGLAICLAVAAAGPFAALALVEIAGPSGPGFVITILGQVMFSLGLLASGALAVAAVRAMPLVRPIPELLIAAGAAAGTIAMGISWWLFYVGTPDIEIFRWLSAIASAGHLLVAGGFWSGALFWPAPDGLVSDAQPSA